jgi:hypothetical protein
MIDAADAISKLLLSLEPVTDLVGRRIYGTALPAELTAKWSSFEDITPTIFCDAEDPDPHGTGWRADCTARLVVFAPDEDQAAAIAAAVSEALCPEGKPTRRIRVENFIFADVRPAGVLQRGEDEAMGWPCCTALFGMGIVQAGA